MALLRSLLIALTALCVSCASVRDARLEGYRQKLTTMFEDTTKPTSIRMEAFNALLDTFTTGTREKTLDRFVGAGEITKSRISSYWREDGVFILGNDFSLHLIAPDGTDRWITMRGDRVN